MADMTLTNEIYWASKDPRVRALQDIRQADGVPDINGRLTAAKKLDDLDILIDLQIDIWGWEPVKVMFVRQTYEYKWSPNAFDVQDVYKHLNAPLNAVIDRGIPVSTDAADYPPFFVVPPFVPSQSPIGTLNGGAYSVNTGVASVNGKLQFKDGQEYTENGHTYIFHNVPGMFGPMLSWTDK